jgi:hypothetical protein
MPYTSGTPALLGLASSAGVVDFVTSVLVLWAGITAAIVIRRAKALAKLRILIEFNIQPHWRGMITYVSREIVR